jgi:carotenoid cleavage dioxygenase
MSKDDPLPATDPADPGNLLPIDFEVDLPSLRVSGELPRELNGTFLRNGPNPRFSEPKSHWFLGDGMLHAFELNDGRARYSNRWVRTPKWKAESEAGRPLLYGGFGGGNAGVSVEPVPDSGTANTNIIRHGARLLALEEGHLPMEIDPASLLATGYCDFEGRLSGPFTAHPKVDPVTGELLFFGYNAAGPFSKTLSFGTIASDGRVTSRHTFEAPFASMVHDFMVTPNHVLFPILPLSGSLARARSGRPPYAWEPELGSWLGALRRDSPEAGIRWFRSEACYVFHVMNAWEEGSLLQADVMQYEAAPLFPRADGRPSEGPTGARLARWTVDLDGSSDRFTRRYTEGPAGEFPRIDERFAGRANRFAWYAGSNRDAPAGTGNGLVQVDHSTGGRHVRRLPTGDTVSEPVFVPRSVDAAEGDGWLLAVVTRGAERRSDVEIHIAGDLALGPVATIHLPHRVPAGFHGNWLPTA